MSLEWPEFLKNNSRLNFASVAMAIIRLEIVQELRLVVIVAQPIMPQIDAWQQRSAEIVVDHIGQKVGDVWRALPAQEPLLKNK